MNDNPSTTEAPARRPLFSVSGLTASFGDSEDRQLCLEDVSFEVYPGQTVALVGETGAGKTTVALAPLGLTQNRDLVVHRGQVLFQGQNLLELSRKQLGQVLGHEVGVVFQDPDAALNPNASVASLLREALLPHKKNFSQSIRQRTLELLTSVGIPNAKTQLHRYPYELPMGVKQRLVLAMALSCHPKLLIADSPTASLDPTTQPQILDLLAQLQEQREMAMLLITHDFGVVTELSDRIVVMHRGRVVEQGSREWVFENPAHPYTQALISSAQTDLSVPTRKLLPTLAMSSQHPSGGCLFRDQCPWPLDDPELAKRCASEVPEPQMLLGDHAVRCHDVEVMSDPTPSSDGQAPIELPRSRAMPPIHQDADPTESANVPADDVSDGTTADE